MYGPLSDAWKTLVPDVNDRHGPLPPLLVALTVVTGLLDAFSYLTLGHVFVANMTGNVVFIAFAVAGVAGFSLSASLIALGAFSVGALIGGRIGHYVSEHRSRLLAGTAAVETILAIGAFICSEIAGEPFSGAGRYLLIILLGLAMGSQNASARRLAVPDLTTTVLTMTLTGVSADGQLAGGADSKAGRRLLSVAAMFLGALIGALMVRHVTPTLNLVVASVILAAVTLVALRFRRSTRSWTTPV